MHHCDSWRIKDQLDVTCYFILFYFTSYVLNMFRTLIYPLSGAWNYSAELPHWSYCSWIDVRWSFRVVGLELYLCCRLKHNYNTDTIPTQPHRNSKTHRTKNNTTNVVIQQNSRKFLMMAILMSETCWAYKKWNNIASDIKLVFYSSTIKDTSHFRRRPLNCKFCNCPGTNWNTLLSPCVQDSNAAPIVHPRQFDSQA